MKSTICSCSIEYDFETISRIAGIRQARFRSSGITHHQAAPDYWDGVCRVLVFKAETGAVMGAANVNLNTDPHVPGSFFHYGLARSRHRFEAVLARLPETPIVEVFRFFSCATADTRFNLQRVAANGLATTIEMFTKLDHLNRAPHFLIMPVTPVLQRAYAFLARQSSYGMTDLGCEMKLPSGSPPLVLLSPLRNEQEPASPSARAFRPAGNRPYATRAASESTP